jgi:membrane-bound lytic murein transglycosylase MltF
MAASVLAVGSFTASWSGAAEPPPAPRQLDLENRPWKGDLDGLIERRNIRFLVPFSRTLYFTDKGRERGLSAELARDFERYLNQKYAKQLGKRPITVLIIPTTRDQILPHLVDGLGDVAAANLTATTERLKVADFVAPADRKPAREILVTGPGSPSVATLEDLSGKTVDVRHASSYFESLVALNGKFGREGRPAVNIKLLPDALEDEDVLEMLNAGILEFTVVDDWKAKLWAQVLPKIKVRDDIAVATEGRIGWAIRPNSPQLRAVIESFYRTIVKRQGLIESRVASYNRRVKQISNNTGGPQLRRFEQTVALFRKYGQKYHFDPLMLVAQGYQESQLNQNAKSHVGAVGVMQIMPATGAELKVGDIHVLESNIHAGAKYMNQLMSRYFPDAKFSENDRSLFAFASYNAGPGNIARMRKLAVKRGLDQDQWFNNVELVVADRIGMETTTYVRNIYKYYAAYKLTLDAQEKQRKAREAHETTKS